MAKKSVEKLQGKRMTEGVLIGSKCLVHFETVPQPRNGTEDSPNGQICAIAEAEGCAEQVVAARLVDRKAKRQGRPGNPFDAACRLCSVDIDDLINQQKRITVRKNALDQLNVRA